MYMHIVHTHDTRFIIIKMTWRMLQSMQIPIQLTLPS